MSILIKNALILTQNEKRERIFGDLYIEDHRIVQISKKPLFLEADYKIDGKNKWVLPGLINTHTHIPMTLLRGYGYDMILKQWLETCIWPVEARLRSNSIEIGTKLGLLEMIASGTTTFSDMYFFEDTVGKITEKAGVRACLGFPMIDFGVPEFPADELFSECEKFLKRWDKHALVTPTIGPHGTYTCGPEILQKTSQLSEKYDAGVQIHCSETREEVYDVEKKYGVRPVEQLKRYGLLNDKTVLAHCGWITKNEVIDIKTGGASVSHCPVSNMKMATGGYAPVPELLDAGVSVGLGTDGAASNNTLDMFETMKFCALVHKQHRWDPQVLPAQTVFDLATIQGSRCLRMQEQIGSLEEGKCADIILVDSRTPHLTPVHDPISHLVYAAKGGDVCTTIVHGVPLMLDRVYQTLDAEQIMQDAQLCAEELIS